MELDRDYFETKANELIKQFHMEAAKHQMPKGFSKGMQQKLMIILVFLIDPDLYIIDEPFIGLDPMSVKQFLLLIDKEKQRGKGILMTTHILDTAEKICDRFIIMNNGEIISQGTIAELQNSINQYSLIDIFYELVERS